MSSDDAKYREPSNIQHDKRNRENDGDDAREHDDDDAREQIDELQRVFALERLVAELS
jgi:hypothetical protein